MNTYTGANVYLSVCRCAFGNAVICTEVLFYYLLSGYSIVLGLRCIKHVGLWVAHVTGCLCHNLWKCYL